MAGKKRPRYPNNRKRTGRLLWGLLVLCLLAGGASFLAVRPSGTGQSPASETGESGADLKAFEQLAASLERSNSGAEPVPAGTEVVQASPADPQPQKMQTGVSVPDSAGAATQNTAPDAAGVLSVPVPPEAPEKITRPESALRGLPLPQVVRELERAHAEKSSSAWGEHLPGITSRLPASSSPGLQPVVALTLDACGGKRGASYDAELIAFLRERQIPATIFMTSRWLRTNLETAKELATDPLFEVAAHGARHMPCSVNGKSVYGIQGTASIAELVAEVEGNARDIEAATGVRPRWFRSGTAYYDDVAVAAIHDMGFAIAGYSIAGDEGATLPAARVAAKTLFAENGDILLYHMNKPLGGTREGLVRALPELQKRGYRFIRLSDKLAAE